MKHFELKVSAPGRICLFGEHQDHLGLPVIAAAINRRVSISGFLRRDNQFEIFCPDIDEVIRFVLEEEIPYQKERDYLRSTVNVLRRSGLRIPSGWTCTITGTIPINSGTASSSAMIIAWVKFLLETGGDLRAGNPNVIAEMAYNSEVAEFGEPGGKMDHYTSALGGVLEIHFGETIKALPLKTKLKTFVLADSLQRKDTTGTLGHIKGKTHCAISKIKQRIPEFNTHTLLKEKEFAEINKLDSDEKRLLLGAFKTRELTKEGQKLFSLKEFDHNRLGLLLDKQQDVLRDHLHVSTSHIDNLLDKARQEGALGGKINGSGGGGCLFVYAPENAESIAEVLNGSGAKASIVKVDSGVRTE